METLQYLIHIILHVDQYLINLVTTFGLWTYALLFGIIFCETGLVIMPFLPGDSLLFAAGSLAGNAQNVLDIKWLFLLLTAASIIGNHFNFLVGRFIGPHLFSTRYTWLLNKNHLQKAHAFYEKHGGKTIILARFIPIIRTFVPFVAGLSDMRLHQFIFYNVLSAILWIGSLLSAGYLFGSLPFIRDHFSIVIYGIIVISLLPTIIGFFHHQFTTSTKQPE